MRGLGDIVNKYILKIQRDIDNFEAKVEFDADISITNVIENMIGFLMVEGLSNKAVCTAMRDYLDDWGDQALFDEEFAKTIREEIAYDIRHVVKAYNDMYITTAELYELLEKISERGLDDEDYKF